MGRKRCLRCFDSSSAAFSSAVLFGVLVCVTLCNAETFIRASDDDSPIITEPPSAPRIVSVQCKNLSAIVEWQPTGDKNDSILEYGIHYNSSWGNDGGLNVVYNIPASELKHEVLDLRPWNNYTFRVIAFNEMGPSLPSDFSESICEMGSDVPYSNPGKVKGYGTASNNLVIAWERTKHDEQGGPGFFYRVFWKRAHIGTKEWQSRDVVDWRQNTVVVNDQPAYVPYEIKVEAHNDLGQSRAKPEVVIGHSGDDRPLASPQNVVSHSRSKDYHGNVIISWDPVPLKSVRGDLQGYKIQVIWTINEKVELVHTFSVGSNVNTFAVPIKENPIRTVVRVLAYNRLHRGPPSEVLTFIHSKGVGYPNHAFVLNPTTFRLFNGKGPRSNPQNLILVEIINQTTAVVAWDPFTEATPYGVFHGYKIQTWSKDENWERLREMIVPENVTSVVLSSLVPYTDNFVRVLALDSHCDGPPSDVLTIKTPEGTPGIISELNVFPMGSTSFQIQWDDPTERNGKLTMFDISYESVDTEPNMKIEGGLKRVNVYQKHVKIIDLVPSTKFRVTVRAATAVGLGIPRSVEASTMAQKTPDKPAFFTFPLNPKVDSGESGVLVKWAPNMNGHPGNKFFVEYRKTGETKWSRTDEMLYGDSVIIPSMLDGIFEVRMTAVDGPFNQTSDIEEVANFAAAEPPRPPEPIPGYREYNPELFVNWNPPSKTGNSYAVSHRKQGNHLWLTSAHVPYNETYKIAELRRGLVYEIKLGADD